MSLKILDGLCVNCKEPWSKQRPIYFEDGRVGIERYCANCPPEKWSQIEVQVTAELNEALNNFWSEIE